MKASSAVGRRLSGAAVMLVAGFGLAVLSGCPGPITDCTTNEDCDDGIACTVDTCGTDGTCVHDDAACPAGEPINLRTASEEEIAALDVQSEISSVEIASPPTVNFTVTTVAGAPIIGIGDLWEADNAFVRFTISKLVPGTNGDPNTWVAYTRDTTNDGATPPDYDSGSALVDHGDGSYTFTFKTDVALVSGVAYEPTLTHRVAGQIGAGNVPLEAQNLYLDFVPNGGSVTTTRNIAVVASCNECHEDLVFHGRRYLVEYCVACHNPDLAEGEGDMAYMTHKIHAGQKFNVLDEGIDYSEVTYPQNLANCRKCHSAEDAATPDGDNWKNKPNMAACGSCHQISFTSPPPEGLTLHTAGAQANNATCAVCHPASEIEKYHLTEIASANNPSVPEGAVNFTYEISEATVNGATNVASIRFRILADAAPAVFGAPGTTLLDGFTGSPSFLFAYALPQSDNANPADWNNLGRPAAQPRTISITNLWNGTDGALAGPDAEGYYTATVPDAFPVGAKLRAVALQAYFTQVSPELARHTPSPVVTVTGDEARREIADGNKCQACHEWFEGHGGNRVIGNDRGVAICATCHVPGLTTSGRAINPADAAGSGAATALGNTDTWTWPEDTNNLKDMIHGIHASSARSTDYEFVRNRQNGLYFNWSEVTYPAENGTRNCLMCHYEGTYELPLNANALVTTVRTSGTEDGLDGNSYTTYGEARNSVPNATDWINTPAASACYYCHDSETAVAHMRQNGGVISLAAVGAADFTQRQDVVTVESCSVCHGDGKISDVGVAHGIE